MGVLIQENNTIDTGEVDVGRRAVQDVPPGMFWRSQIFIDQPQYLKFNISVQRDALVGVYGRKGLPPSHTQVCVMTIWPVETDSQLASSSLSWECMGEGVKAHSNFLHPSLALRIHPSIQTALW